jgi:tetratricopeptide (TPR) repeat protein
MRWDSARFHYERAVLLDSTFAPALYHLARTLEWLNNDDPTAGVIALRAAANNHSLPPRDSLLILADSFGTSAKVGLQPRPEYRLLVRRQLAVLEDATALYPQDPELWHELGEARLHLAFAVGLVQLPETLEAFERAVTLDPGLMEAAFHALELAINLGEPGRAMRTAARLAGDRSARRMGGWHQLAVGLLDSTYASADESIARVDVREVVRAFSLLRAWPDSGETAVRMARRIMQSRDSGSTAVRVPAHRVLAMELARRGHLRQMMRMGEDTAVRYLPYLARLGLVPLTEARAAFEVSLARQAYDTDRRWTVSVSWFAEQRDTARLRRALERAEQAFDSLRRAAPTSPALWKQPWVSEYLRTHLDLAVGDTAAALRRLRHVVDSLCTSCRDEVLLFGHLLAQQGRAHEAAALLQHDHSLAFTWDEWRTGEWALLRAQVAEAIGDQEVARKKYQYVLDLWRHADPEFEPELRAARLGLARVSAEPT